MKQKNRVPLSLEALEDRWVPATVRYVNGDLIISNPLITGGKSSLTLTQTAQNTWQVVDGSSSLGTYSAVGNIFVLGNNAASSDSINLNGFSYTGNLLVNTGNGTDTVWVNSSAAGGALLGNTTLLAGNGRDKVLIGGPTASGVFFGGQVVATSTEGADSVTLGNGSDTFAGNVTVTNAQAVTIGTGADAFNGNVTVSSPLVNTPMTVTTGTGVIAGSLSVYGGSGADTVTLAAASVGSVNITLGNGNNTFTNTAATTVTGNFTLQQGEGNDSVTTINAGTTFQGNAAFNFGDGNNVLAPTTAFTVQGNLSVHAGNGADSVSLAATVNSNLNYVFGNGNDSVTSTGTVGGIVNWTSGNGNDSFTLGSDGNNYNVNVGFGNGADTFALATTGFVSGNVRGGTNPNNAFVQDGATLSSPWTISNFP